MAIIDATGITGTTLEEYIDFLQDIFKTVLGDKVDLSDQSPQGQIIGALGLTLSQMDDTVINESNGYDANRASGGQQDSLYGTLNVNRSPGTFSTVPVVLNGAPGALVLAGHKVKSDNGDIFVLSTNTTIDGTGSTAGNYIAEVAGPAVAEVGQITTIVDVVANLDSVNNETDAVVGSLIESDSDYRASYFQNLFKNAVSVLEAVVANVAITVDGVVDIYGAENDTDVPKVVDGVTLPPHSIAIVVEGGDDDAIGVAIVQKKTGGADTSGAVTVQVPRLVGPLTPTSFYRPQPIDAEVILVTTAGQDFPQNGLVLLEQRILDYINGTFEICKENTGQFETDGMTISEDLSKYRLLTPINSVPGHTVTSLQIRVSGGSFVDVITANLNEKIRIVSDADISVTVN